MDFLIPQEKYLEAGAHIGTKTKHGSMREFIYKARDDGLHVLDLKKMDERIRLAARFLAKYDNDKIAVVGSKDNAQKPIAKFCEILGAQALNGRFTPGRFTNPSRFDFVEPGVVLVTDPGVDRQAVKEAFEVHVPILSLCDTNNSTRFIELCIPVNNKGRKSIALMYWLLAREILRAEGKIEKDEDYPYTPQDFEG